MSAPPANKLVYGERDQYELDGSSFDEAQVGEGQYGVVYKASARGSDSDKGGACAPGTVVALKKIRSGRFEDGVERVVEEQEGVEHLPLRGAALARIIARAKT